MRLFRWLRFVLARLGFIVTLLALTVCVCGVVGVLGVLVLLAILGCLIGGAVVICVLVAGAPKNWLKKYAAGCIEKLEKGEEAAHEADTDQ